MTVGTWGWLKKVCEHIPDETKILIEISAVKFPLSGKIDKALMTFTIPDQPGMKRGEDVLVISPYEGEGDRPKKITPDDLPKN